MNSFVQNSILGKSFVGIEFFSVSNEERIAFLQVLNKKNELIITKQSIFTNKNALLLEKSKLPAAVVVNNQQVLQKEIDSVDTNDKKLIHRAFPNLNLDEFYYEITRLEGFSIVAICRKKYIDELLSSIEKDFYIMQINLGVGIIKQIKSYGLPEIIYTNTQLIDFKQQQDRIKINDVLSISYQINGLEIKNSYLLPFCGILNIILKNQTSSGNITELNSELSYKAIQKLFYSFSIKSGLTVILAILVINFMAFSFYFDKVSTNNALLNINKTDLENIRGIKLRINNKEEKVSTLLSHSISKSSKKINEITKPLPSSILLTGINYNPLERKIKENEEILFQDKLMVVTGNTINNEDFTEWVEEVETFDWVKKVTIVSFGKNQEGKTVFEVKIESI